MEVSQRLGKLPRYLFARIDALKAELVKEGRDVIDLGVGDPDLPTPEPIVEEAVRSLHKPENHRYPSYKGLLKFRETASKWVEKRFGVEFDPEKEVLTLIGSKEGIAHLPFAFVDCEDDVVLVPDPAYPVYANATILAGGTPYKMPLRESNGFFPDFSEIPDEILNRTKLMFLNYPNNPTSAVAVREQFEEAVKLAEKYGFIIASDAAYTEIYSGSEKPLSIMQVDGAREVAVEFHSLSKTFCMTGWRIGFVVGSGEVISSLGKVKTHIDSGVFQVVQEAGIKALELYDELTPQIRQIFADRREVGMKKAEEVGLEVYPSNATFYLWIKTPNRMSSAEAVEKILKESAVVVTPGSGFGDSGEGYFRVALTSSKERIEEAFDRIGKALG